MPIHGVIFDLGSTLIHRTGLELERDKCGALAQLAAEEWRCPDPAALAAHLLEIRLDGWRRAEVELVERPASDSIAQAFARAGLPVDAETLRRAEAAFFEPEVRHSRLYPAAAEILERLRAMGCRIGMISNATSHGLIVEITARHGIGGYFHPLVSSAGHGKLKPHPDIFTHVLDAWAVDAQHAVMVGDTLAADIAGAHAVGMRSILVDIEPNPANARFTGPGATARVEALREIPVLIERWSAGR